MKLALIVALLTLAPGPTPLVIPSLRVHVHVSEELDPDALNRLARPGVTLWVSTRSNALKSSWLERLGKFDEAYVEMRPPFLPAHLAQLARTPRTGIWLISKDGAFTAPRRDSRPLAAEVRGPFSAAALAGVNDLRPRRVRWVAPEELSVMDWALFNQAPGALVMDAESLDAPCDLKPLGRVRVRTVHPPPACGVHTLAVVAPAVSEADLRKIYSADPGAELEIDVGADAEAAAATADLVARLQG